jgi:hypothetical protein
MLAFKKGIIYFIFINHPLLITSRMKMPLLSGQSIQILGDQGKFFTVITLGNGPGVRADRPIRADADTSGEEDILVCGRCKAQFSQIEQFLSHKRVCCVSSSTVRTNQPISRRVQVDQPISSRVQADQPISSRVQADQPISEEIYYAEVSEEDQILYFERGKTGTSPIVLYCFGIVSSNT